MRIMIADQRVEDHVVEQAQRLRRTGARDAAHQCEALRQTRSNFELDSARAFGCASRAGA